MSEIGDNLLHLLADIQMSQLTLHLLVTSRLHINQCQFPNAVEIEVRASDSDIRRYLTTQIQTRERLRRHTKSDPDLQATLINTIAQKTEGM